MGRQTDRYDRITLVQRQSIDRLFRKLGNRKVYCSLNVTLFEFPLRSYVDDLKFLYLLIKCFGRYFRNTAKGQPVE